MSLSPEYIVGPRLYTCAMAKLPPQRSKGKEPIPPSLSRPRDLCHVGKRPSLRPRAARAQCLSLSSWRSTKSVCTVTYSIFLALFRECRARAPICLWAGKAPVDQCIMCAYLSLCILQMSEDAMISLLTTTLHTTTTHTLH